MVPVNVRAVTPTTVTGMPFTRTVLPTNDGDNPVLRQTAYDAIATGARVPGRSSSSVNGRPAASGTPRVSK
jgi:hypothetical protein